jgi:drug/metabolite transporter (DMT)-like permease
MNKGKIVSIFLALSAAIFYALNIPISKILLNYINPTLMASLLYFGAGIGVSILYFINIKKSKSEENLEKNDLIYVISMVLLDIIAPILLMFGILYTNSSTVSLINNFEIVATSLIALLLFKENISKRLWLAILLITISSFILSFEDIFSLKLSFGAVLVVLATLCWGLENNCTKKISSKNTYQIVIIKGIFSGLGSLIISLIIGESFSSIKYILFALLLGFISYGLSIFFYIKAQRNLGAAKTSAYYAVAPFVGAILSFLILKENLSSYYFLSLIIMIIGTGFSIIDTIKGESKN